MCIFFFIEINFVNGIQLTLEINFYSSSTARPCGPPTDIPHGWHAGECYTYGCRINYHCADGYELVGRNERFCQADGTWSPKDLPTCVRK